MRPPPGYPFAGDIPSRPPPPPGAESPGRARRARDGDGGEAESRSLGAAFVLAFAGAMMGAGFMLVALVTAQSRHAAQAAQSPLATSPMALSAEDSLDDSAEPTAPRKVVDSPVQLPPPITRNVPVFPGRFLEGCSAADLETIERVLSATIGKGAPLYNDGDVAGCADAYDQGARDLEEALPPSCSGPTHALAESRAAASKLELPNGRAWALRDAFDGLIEVLDRSRSSGVNSL